MKRLLKRGLATAMALSLMMAFATFNAGAVTYTPIGGQTTITTNLVVDSDANIPNVTFDYTITRVPAKAATATTSAILESTVGASIGQASFSNSDTSSTKNGLPSDALPGSTTGKKYAQKRVTVTFPNDSFTCPGVYRYRITESTGSAPGVTYEVADRYLDVFVTANDNDELSAANYVLRNSESDIGTNLQYTTPTAKSDGYTNTVTQYDFRFTKAISGNQGDKNKRFTFTLSISNAIPGTYPISATDVTGNPTTITVGADGKFTGTFDLTNGSSLHVKELNKGAICTVNEDEQDYTATHIVDSGSSTSGNSSGAISLTDADHTVAFTNTKNGTIPTGVLLTVTPFAVGLLLFGALAFFMMARSRRGY